MTDNPPGGATALWVLLATVSGVIALVGFALALYGFWLTFMSYLVYRRDHDGRQRSLGIVLVGDVLFFVVLIGLAVIQLLVAGNLVVLGDHYEGDLAPILARLNHLIFPAYLGYAVSVLVGTLLAPGYILVRFLSAPARRRGARGPDPPYSTDPPPAGPPHPGGTDD